ncbi:unnamed protein product [Amoebophrya sp. A120]|nr:unnamed protein product [Amoebophrya sp. A120]|eukprot:GSA120T00000638001.1
MLTCILTAYGRRMLGEAVDFSSVQVNKDAPAALHVDGRNESPVRAVALVDESQWGTNEESPEGNTWVADDQHGADLYCGPLQTGGEREQLPARPQNIKAGMMAAFPGRVIDLKNKLGVFDGSKMHTTIPYGCSHYIRRLGGPNGFTKPSLADRGVKIVDEVKNISDKPDTVSPSTNSSAKKKSKREASRPHAPRRYFLSFYTHTSVRKLSEADRDELAKLGFRLPSRQEAGTMKINQEGRSDTGTLSIDGDRGTKDHRSARDDHDALATGDETSSQTGSTAGEAAAQEEEEDYSGEILIAQIRQRIATDLEMAEVEVVSSPPASYSQSSSSSSGAAKRRRKADGAAFSDTEAVGEDELISEASVAVPGRFEFVDEEGVSEEGTRTSQSVLDEVTMPAISSSRKRKNEKEHVDILPPSLRCPRPTKHCICGVAISGKGSIAGSLVAACFVIPPGRAEKDDTWGTGVVNPLSLPKKKREAVFKKLTGPGSSTGIGRIRVAELDTKFGGANDQAVQAAVKKCVEDVERTRGLRITKVLIANPDHYVPDSLRTRKDLRVERGCHNEDFVVAAAKFLSKVTHDEEFKKMATDFPAYQFAKNNGYVSSKAHQDALSELGPCLYHRKCTRPVQNAMIARDAGRKEKTSEKDTGTKQAAKPPPGGKEKKNHVLVAKKAKLVTSASKGFSAAIGAAKMLKSTAHKNVPVANAAIAMKKSTIKVVKK